MREKKTHTSSKTGAYWRQRLRDECRNAPSLAALKRIAQRYNVTGLSKYKAADRDKLTRLIVRAHKALMFGM